MKELQNFNFSGQDVRIIAINGKPWFVGKDVADILGYSNSRKALSDHVDDEDKGVTKSDTLGGNQNITIINESGLYSLILKSKKQKPNDLNVGSQAKYSQLSANTAHITPRCQRHSANWCNLRCQQTRKRISALT